MQRLPVLAKIRNILTERRLASVLTRELLKAFSSCRKIVKRESTAAPFFARWIAFALGHEASEQLLWTSNRQLHDLVNANAMRLQLHLNVSRGRCFLGVRLAHE